MAQLVPSRLSTLVFFPMVEPARGAQLVEPGPLGLGPFEGVVHVHEVGAVTPLHITPHPPELQRGALMCRGPSLEVGDV